MYFAQLIEFNGKNLLQLKDLFQLETYCVTTKCLRFQLNSVFFVQLNVNLNDRSLNPNESRTGFR